MFNLKDFLFTGFEKSLEEGSMGEGQVRMAAVNYMMKGILVEEDLMRVETIIQNVKDNKEREKDKEEEQEDNFEVVTEGETDLVE